MHILFLTDNFPPEVNAPASRTFEHTREWVKAGHKVTVITCVPNFPKGKIFDGYSNLLWQHEKIEGINVLRVWTYISSNEGFVLRVLDYISFMLSSTVGALFVKRVDVVIGTSPQFFTVCGAYLVSLLKRIPFVFELRDLWPDSIKAVGVTNNSVILSLLKILEYALYRNADAIIAVTHSFKRHLIKNGVPQEKIFVITNGVNLSLFTPGRRDEALIKKLSLDDRFICGYIGTLGMAHGLETLLDAAESLWREGYFEVCILFLGDGACKASLKSDAQRRGLTNVFFIDTVSKSDVVRYWSILDISIIHLRPNDVFENVIPSKIFESMAMGVPLVHGVPGESSEIVQREEVGIVFRSGDFRALCESILTLRKHTEIRKNFSTKCLKAVQKYDRLTLAADVLSVILSLQSKNNKKE
jgi:glycosyltransferase involved in cell wall biosynthesis